MDTNTRDAKKLTIHKRACVDEALLAVAYMNQSLDTLRTRYAREILTHTGTEEDDALEFECCAALLNARLEVLSALLAVREPVAEPRSGT